MNILKRKEALANIESRCGAMTSETKNFIQKICYKKSASIDMTRYGFIQDSKVRPINLMMKPLKEQLERIWGWFQNLFYRYVRLTLYLPRWRSDLRIACDRGPGFDQPASSYPLISHLFRNCLTLLI